MTGEEDQGIFQSLVQWLGGKPQVQPVRSRELNGEWAGSLVVLSSFYLSSPSLSKHVLQFKNGILGGRGPVPLTLIVYFAATIFAENTVVC